MHTASRAPARWQNHTDTLSYQPTPTQQEYIRGTCRVSLRESLGRCRYWPRGRAAAEAFDSNRWFIVSVGWGFIRTPADDDDDTSRKPGCVLSFHPIALWLIAMMWRWAVWSIGILVNMWLCEIARVLLFLATIEGSQYQSGRILCIAVKFRCWSKMVNTC